MFVLFVIVQKSSIRGEFVEFVRFLLVLSRRWHQRSQWGLDICVLTGWVKTCNSNHVEACIENHAYVLLRLGHKTSMPCIIGVIVFRGLLGKSPLLVLIEPAQLKSVSLARGLFFLTAAALTLCHWIFTLVLFQFGGGGGLPAPRPMIRSGTTSWCMPVSLVSMRPYNNSGMSN